MIRRPEMQQKVYVQEDNMPEGWLVEKKYKNEGTNCQSTAPERK
jgi:hypothetical protein